MNIKYNTILIFNILSVLLKRLLTQFRGKANNEFCKNHKKGFWKKQHQSNLE